jgi:ParB/RepB/Spo0J family partition protein
MNSNKNRAAKDTTKASQSGKPVKTKQAATGASMSTDSVLAAARSQPRKAQPPTAPVNAIRDVATITTQVPLTRIVMKPERFAFRDPEDLVASHNTPIDELARSIAAMGGLQTPLLVHDLGEDSYLLVDGHRRYAALRWLIKLKFKNFSENMLVPVNVLAKDASDFDLLLRAVTANVERLEFSPLGRINAASQLRKHGLRVSKIAELLGKSESTVERALAVASDAEMLQHVKDHNITATNAAALIKLAYDKGRAKEFRNEFETWLQKTVAGIEAEEMRRAEKDEASLNPSEKWPQKYLSVAQVKAWKEAIERGEPLGEPVFKFKAVVKENRGRQVIEIDPLSIDVDKLQLPDLCKVVMRLNDIAEQLEPIVAARAEAEKRSANPEKAEPPRTRGRERLREMGLDSYLEADESAIKDDVEDDQDEEDDEEHVEDVEVSAEEDEAEAVDFEESADDDVEDEVGEDAEGEDEDWEEEQGDLDQDEEFEDDNDD